MTALASPPTARPTAPPRPRRGRAWLAMLAGLPLAAAGWGLGVGARIVERIADPGASPLGVAPGAVEGALEGPGPRLRDGPLRP